MKATKKQAVKPFRATYYNQEKILDFSKVICPPYDVISKEKAAFLKTQSPYNYCRITLAFGNNYDRPAHNLKKWLKEKVLVDDTQESYYLYQRKFILGKNEVSCYGIFCLLNMEKKEIFPHEHTLDKPKEDRRKIIAKVKANLSPIYVIAGGTNNFLKELFQKHKNKTPFLEFTQDQEGLNRIWKINDSKDRKIVSSALVRSYLVIADGHHRFETTFDYHKKTKGKFKDSNYILSYVTVPHPGLIVLPTHRIVTSSASSKINLNIIRQDFNLEQISQKGLERKLKLNKKFCFGLYLKNNFYFASLKKKDIFDRIEPSVYRKLDSYILHKCVLPKLSCRRIDYSHSIAEAKKSAGKNKMIFILKPVSLNAVFDIAKAGYRLPQKSTYFYPKVFSGIVMRRLMK